MQVNPERNNQDQLIPPCKQIRICRLWSEEQERKSVDVSVLWLDLLSSLSLFVVLVSD